MDRRGSDLIDADLRNLVSSASSVFSFPFANREGERLLIFRALWGIVWITNEIFYGISPPSPALGSLIP